MGHVSQKQNLWVGCNWNCFYKQNNNTTAQETAKAFKEILITNSNQEKHPQASTCLNLLNVIWQKGCHKLYAGFPMPTPTVQPLWRKYSDRSTDILGHQPCKRSSWFDQSENQETSKVISLSRCHRQAPQDPEKWHLTQIHIQTLPIIPLHRHTFTAYLKTCILLFCFSTYIYIYIS